MDHEPNGRYEHGEEKTVVIRSAYTDLIFLQFRGRDKPSDCSFQRRKK